MQGIRLDQNALKIQLAKELPQHRSFEVLHGGVAGLADGHTEGGGVQRDLWNERRAATSCGLDRTPQGLAVTHQPIKIVPTTWDLRNRLVADSGARKSDAKLAEEVKEGCIRRRPPEFEAKRLCQDAVMADGKALPDPAGSGSGSG